VYVYTAYGDGSHVNFVMKNGTISGNTTATTGGGVYVTRGPFTMEGGTISGNTAATSGGGVYVSGGSSSAVGGTFTMEGGTVSGNTAATSGGGVYVGYYNATYYGTFTKTGGTIYGDTPMNTTHTPGSTENTVTSTATATLGKNGHAVMFSWYISYSVYDYYYRNEDLTGADNISTTDPLPANSGDIVGKWTKR
jgi:hypothetical protein